MKVKICFNDEIHRLSKVPETFKAFTLLLATTFQAKLPENWTLKYFDSNGESLSITDEKEFEKFRNQDLQSASMAVKVYIVPIENLAAADEKANPKDNGDYEVIQKEEAKVENLSELKIEEMSAQPTESKSQEVEENKEDHAELADLSSSAITTQKVFVDMAELEKMIQRILDSKIAEMTESIKSQLIMSNSSLSIPQHEEKEEDSHDILREKLEAEIKAKAKEEEEKAAENYYNNLMEKAKKLLKCFPKEDFDMLCAYVSGAPEDMTLEELVENFKH